MSDQRQQSIIRSKSVFRITLSSVEEDDDVMQPSLETQPQAKSDINALKNEILTGGMQVSSTGYIATYSISIVLL